MGGKLVREDCLRIPLQFHHIIEQGMLATEFENRLSSGGGGR
jgi:hypothetical protein